jgi:hypothetical protein
MAVEIDFGVCALADYDEDGHAQIQTDSPGVDGSEGTQPAETLMPFGMHARPLDPDRGPSGEVGLGASCLTVTIGDRRYVLPLQDPRDVADGKIPKLKKGGVQLAGGAGDHRSFVNIDGEDPAGAKQPGSVMIAASYTKSGAKKTLGISLNVRDAGSEDISIVHGEGTRITVSKTGTTIAAPNGKHYLEVSNDGIVLAGTVKVQGALTVGEQTAAMATVDGPALVTLLSSLIAVVAQITAVTPGAPAAALAAGLPAILKKHLKST